MPHLWLQRLLNAPAWWLLLCSLLLVVLSFGASSLYFRGDFRIFFSKENPQLQAFERMQARFNKTDNVFIAIEPRDGQLFSQASLTAIQQLTEAAWQTPYSIRVDSLTNFQRTKAVADDLHVADLVPQDMVWSSENIQELQAFALAEPTLRGRMLDAEARLGAINITVQLPEKNQQQEVQQVHDAVQTMVATWQAQHPDLKVYLAGVITLNQAFSDEAQRDAQTLIPLMFAVIVLVLALMLRSFGAALAVVLVIITSISGTMGAAGWAGMFLSTATVNVPIIVMTLAVADSVHLIAATQLAMRQGHAKPQAILLAMQHNRMPVFITSITTAIGFLTLNFSDVPILRDFGNLCAFGVMLAWLLSVVMLPLLLKLLPLSQGHAMTQSRGFSHLAQMVIRFHRPILLGFTALFAVSLWLTLQNRINDEPVKYFTTQTQYRQNIDYLEPRLGGVAMLDFAIDAGEISGVHQPAFLQALDAFSAHLRQLQGVQHVTHIADVMKRLNRSMHGDDASFYQIPATAELAAQYLLMYEMSLPFGLDLSHQLDMDKQVAKVAVTLGNLGSKDVMALEQQALAWFQQQYPQYSIEASSTALMFAYIGERNMASMLQGLPLALVLISVLLIFSLKSVRLGLLSMIPNLVPAVIGFGIWALLSGEINLGLSVVASMSLGIIVDDTVHFLAKYQAARQQGLAADAAIMQAFAQCGRALMITTVVLVLGFAMLTGSHFRLNADMGLLTSIVLSVALLLDLVFLPALLLLFDRRATTPAADALQQPVLSNTKSPAGELE